MLYELKSFKDGRNLWWEIVRRTDDTALVIIHDDNMREMAQEVLKPRSDAKNIGDQLRAARKIRRMSQQETAEELGISRTHISNIERGEVRLHHDTYDKIAKFVGGVS